LEAVLRSVSDGIVVTDQAGETVQANPIADAWLTKTLSPQDQALLRDAVRAMAKRAEERPQEVLELRGLDLELQASPIVADETDEPAVVVALHDVSHLKALDRMKTHFVTNVSHELRTPITTIKLYAELMRRKPEKWQDYLDILTKEADHQARLVEDILHISRIDTGRLEMKPRPVSLNELVETAFVSHQLLAEEQQLRLEHGLADPQLMTLVDPERMMQVLSNLLVNAIRYTPEEGTISLTTGTAQEDGRLWAIIAVKDSGVGIPEEELPHVFERFFRGERTRQMQLSGTGLGLAIVKEIVELHGGWVSVDSSMDVGTTFTVWLPLVD
jgi:signal transduction histidine kinase